MPDNDRIDWRLAIEETERTLTSTDPEDCVKGNIPYDISRMITRVAQSKSQYARYKNIRTVLQFFVLQHYLHGHPLILNTQEAPLVEASVGRIMDVAGRTKRTVLDEPFALRAAVKFLRKDDPTFTARSSAYSACHLNVPSMVPIGRRRFCLTWRTFSTTKFCLRRLSFLLMRCAAITVFWTGKPELSAWILISLGPIIAICR